MIGEVRSPLLTTADLTAGVEFYSLAFDLKLKYRDGDGWAVLTDGQRELSLASRPITAGADPIALMVKVVDLDVAVRKLEALGARRSGEVQIGNHEVRQLMHDPSGNPLLLYGQHPSDLSNERPAI